MRYEAAAAAGGLNGATVDGSRGDQAGGSHGLLPRAVAPVTARKMHHGFRDDKESVAHFCFPIEFQLLSHVESDAALCTHVVLQGAQPSRLR